MSDWERRAREPIYRSPIGRRMADGIRSFAAVTGYIFLLVGAISAPLVFLWALIRVVRFAWSGS